MLIVVAYSLLIRVFFAPASFFPCQFRKMTQIYFNKVLLPYKSRNASTSWALSF